MERHDTKNGRITLVLSIALLVATLSFGQDNVRLINGAGYLSEVAVNAATARLSNELPNHDVRITYVTNFINISDRYSVYDSLGLMPFTQVPNEAGGFPPATQEEKDAAVNAAIHEALTTANGGNNTIHIIYAAAVSLNAQAEEEVISRKFLHFGNDVKRLDEMKVRQIVPSPELEVLSGALQNDQYLADYVDELIAALNDPDYVINGTVRYEGNVYADGDTIFYFSDHIGNIENPLAGREWLELLINPRYPVNNEDWEEINTITTLIEEENGVDVFLRLQPTHFQGIHTLRATYDNNSTTVYFYPVNLQINVGDEHFEYLEPFAPVQEYDVYAYNNGLLFYNHPGLNIRTRVERNNGTFLSTEAIAVAPSGNDQLTFGISPLGLSPSDGRRFYINMDLINATGEVLYTKKRRIFVKWPFEVQDLIVTPTNVEGDLVNARYVKSTSSDTLYIVSKDNDIDRDIKFEIDWTGNPPVFIDYWQYSPESVVNLEGEPVYYFGSSNNPVDIPQPSIQARRNGPIMVEYDSRFFPGAGIFNPDLGDVDINNYKAGVRLFDQHHFVNLAFLRENRRTQQITLPNWLVGIENFINNHFNTAFDKIEAIIPPPLELDVGVSIETTANRTTFLTEDDVSSGYVINREQAIGASIGLGANLGWDLAPGPWITIGPYVDVGVSVGLAYEYAERRLHNIEDFTPDAHTVEMPFTGEIALGAIIALNLHDQDTTGINFVTDVNGSFPIELKPKIQKKIAPPTGSCLIIEANGGPASLNISISLGAQFNWGALDVDFNILDLNWSYPVTDKYFTAPFTTNLTGEWDCQ